MNLRIHLLCRLALAALGPCVAARAQTLSFAPQPTMPLAGRLVFDDARGVVIVLEARTGRMWEWDGRAFRARLGVAHPGASEYVFDPVRREITSSTYAWNGANWRQRALPAGWSIGAIAYDEPRRRLVGVFGAGTPGVAEWDGSQWTRITPPASPGLGGALCYDPSRGACVLAIGAPVTLWTWDGSQWNLLDANGPAIGAGSTYDLEFDAGAARLVVHGFDWPQGVAITSAYDSSGWSAIPTPATFSTGASFAWDGTGMLRLGSNALLPEGLWRLEGSTWRQLPVDHPPTREEAALASTPARPDVLVFGGRTSSQALLADTWLYDGAWQRRLPAHSPPPRRAAGLAWSTIDQAFVLFGGHGPQGTLLADTWLWDGTDWTQQSPANSPSGAVQLVADPSGGVLALGRISAATNDQWRWQGSDWSLEPGHGASFGGATVLAVHDPSRNVVTAAVGAYHWEWDGTQWTQRGPMPDYDPHSAAYRPDTRGVIFFFTSGLQFEWDGTVWRSLSVPDRPAARGLATDYRLGRAWSFQHGLTVSGSSGENGAPAVLTTTPATAARFGQGCAIGASPGLVADGRPVPGDGAFGIQAATLAPNAPCVLAVGFATQAVHLGSGCVAWLASPAVVSFALADAAGCARLGLPIPADPGLRGVAFAAQLAVVDPPRGPLGGLTLSDALSISLGD